MADLAFPPGEPLRVLHLGGGALTLPRYLQHTRPASRQLVADGQNYPTQWWLTIFPGLVIVLIVLCVNFVGDGLRDALDPQQRRVRA